MEIFLNLNRFSPASPPIVLTIGTFDGVHRGHQLLFEKMKLLAGHSKKCALMTFSNHPKEIVQASSPQPLICSLSHRLQLIEKEGIDSLFLLTFDRLFAEQSAETFISTVRGYIPFSDLVLGHDATLGKERKGDRSLMPKIADELQFHLHYVEPFSVDGMVVSSTKAREFLNKGRFDLVEKLLGRSYSILADFVDSTDGLKANVRDLSLPPPGKYEVKLNLKEGLLHAQALLTPDFLLLPDLSEESFMKKKCELEVIF